MSKKEKKSEGSHFLTMTYTPSEDLDSYMQSEEINYLYFSRFDNLEDLHRTAFSKSDRDEFRFAVKWVFDDFEWDKFSRYSLKPTREELEEFSRAYGLCGYDIIPPGDGRNYWYVYPLGDFYYLKSISLDLVRGIREDSDSEAEDWASSTLQEIAEAFSATGQEIVPPGDGRKHWYSYPFGDFSHPKTISQDLISAMREEPSSDGWASSTLEEIVESFLTIIGGVPE